VFDLEIMV